MKYLPLQPGGEQEIAWFTARGKRTTAVMITPIWNTGFGDQQRIFINVGKPYFQMGQCEGVAANQRSVVVNLSVGGFDDTPLLDALLRQAAIFAWKHCPKPSANPAYGRTYDLDVGNVKLVLPEGFVAFEAQGFHGDQDGQRVDARGRPVVVYQWGQWFNHVKEHNDAVEASDRNVKLALWCIAIGVFAFLRREPILRFYYFNFYPHPAAPMVRSIVEYGGDTSDITRGFAEALNEVPPHSRILRKVRLEQTDALVTDMKMANAAREREFARQAKNDAIASFEREAFYGSQQAMALAVEALERSKRAYATATELRGREI